MFSQWGAHLLRGTVILLGILVYQWWARGQIDLIIAVLAAAGYVLVREAVLRYRASES